MPTNLPPQYFEVEKEYRAARTPQEKIEALERMLAIMPHHKGTDHLRAELRTRISKHQQEAERQRASGTRTDFYSVRKEGAGQVALVGLPNAGKSALLRALTGAPAKVADYPFATQLPQPAMMPFEDIHVQLVDGPPVVPGETPGWLRGLFRQADLLLLVLDLAEDPLAQLRALEGALEGASLVLVRPDAEISPDALPRPRRAILVANKLDLPGTEDSLELFALELGERLPLEAVSAERGDGLDELRRRVVAALDIVRVYAKPPGRPPDLQKPFVLHRGATIQDLAETIHKDLPQKLRYAVLWPTHHPPQRVARDYLLHDRDVIELHAG
jgi:ribosome-interacting GTPase 1